ncbi:MAG: cytochrome b5 domain-containing protein [Nigerium sp.]|nr:cytochrome b5 domain-containing protein [Nigerium sp.]
MSELEILGLPLHPLVVHLVVVALPVGALATMAAVLSPVVRSRYGTLALATLSVGALASVAAMITGTILAETETRPEQHASFGTWTVIAALTTSAIAWAWWVLERRREQTPPGHSGLAAMVSGAVAVTGAVAVVGLTVATGHSGAQATWGTRAAVPPASGSTATPTTGASAASGSAATPDIDRTYSLDEVTQHDDASSCWAVVAGQVYDLTGWVNQHPGGPARILALCGTDASLQFEAQHSGQARPERQLASFRLGSLAP